MFVYEGVKMPEDECTCVYMRSEESEVHVDVKHKSSKGTECMSEMSMSDRLARVQGYNEEIESCNSGYLRITVVI